MPYEVVFPAPSYEQSVSTRYTLSLIHILIFIPLYFKYLYTTEAMALQEIGRIGAGAQKNRLDVYKRQFPAR